MMATLSLCPSANSVALGMASCRQETGLAASLLWAGLLVSAMTEE